MGLTRTSLVQAALPCHLEPMGTLWGWSFWDANFTTEGRLGGALVRQKESKIKKTV